MVKIRVGNPVVGFDGVVNGIKGDRSWDGRDTKTIIIETEYATAKELFVNNAAWFIVDNVKKSVPLVDEEGHLVYDEDGNPIINVIEEEIVYDNSDYCVAGDITDHRDGRISIKMGKLTELEEAYELLLGGM